MNDHVILKTERLCKWCGGHLMYKKRGTHGDFCNNDHARLYRRRDEAKRNQQKDAIRQFKEQR